MAAEQLALMANGKQLSTLMRPAITITVINQAIMAFSKTPSRKRKAI